LCRSITSPLCRSRVSSLSVVLPLRPVCLCGFLINPVLSLTWRFFFLLLFCFNLWAEKFCSYVCTFAVFPSTFFFSRLLPCTYICIYTYTYVGALLPRHSLMHSCNLFSPFQCCAISSFFFSGVKSSITLVRACLCVSWFVCARERRREENESTFLLSTNHHFHAKKKKKGVDV
jgi:hypothetical protein